MTEPAALVFEERRFTLPQLDALADGLVRALANVNVSDRKSVV